MRCRYFATWCSEDWAQVIQKLIGYSSYRPGDCALALGSSSRSFSLVGFQLIGIFSNAKPRYIAEAHKVSALTSEMTLHGQLTDRSPLPWIHVQVSLVVDDLHALRHHKELWVLHMLGKDLVKVFAVDALELVFRRDAVRAAISMRGKDTRRLRTP